MTKVRTVILILFAALFMGSACNLPAVQRGAGTAAVVLTVSVNAPAVYRTGPGEDYAPAGVLNPGQQVEAIGRNPDGDYLFIQDPASRTVLGWLPSEVALTDGNPFNLPISLPPLLPGPAVSGCPSPVGGGPTPVSCPTLVEEPPVSGCPSPVGGGPTPVSCPTLVPAAPSGGGKPTPVRGPTAVKAPTKVPGPTAVPTTVQ